MTLYVGNLSYQVSPEDLKEVFSEYGTVKNVQLPSDRETGRPRGFGFVEMGSEAEETAGIEALDGAELLGRPIQVKKARPKEESGGGSYGRSGGGGGGGYGRGGGDRRGGGGW